MATIATHSGNSVALGHNQRAREYVLGESHIREDGRHWSWEPRHGWSMEPKGWESEEEVYDFIFTEACDEYANECGERGHPERCKSPQDVLDAQRRHGRPAIRELVCGVYPDDGEEVSEETEEKILKDFAQRFMKKFPSMYVTGVYFHADEQGKAPHIHLDYVPVAERQSRGLPLSPSMKGALRDMGYSDKVNGKTVRAHALTSWTADVNHLLEDVCAEYGVHVTHPDRDKHAPHLDTRAYKAVQDARKDAEAKAREEAEQRVARATQDAQRAAEAKAQEIEAEAKKKAAKTLSEAQRRQDAVDSRKRLVEERERIADERVQRGVDEGFQDAMTTAKRHTDEAHAIAATMMVMDYFRETRANDNRLMKALDVVDDALDDEAADERGMSRFKQWWHAHLAKYFQVARDVLATMVETVTGYRPFAAGGIGVDGEVGDGTGGTSRGDREPANPYNDGLTW